MIKELLTEKLRPKELKHMILPQRIKGSFKNGLQQNVLLAGSPGSGKTSMAKILIKNHPYIFINVSDESSVETIRTKVHDFCSTVSILDGENQTKIVVLDEFDGASDQFYKALRGTIEKYARTTRFIATCNYLSKIPDAIRSRFEVYDFDPINKEEENEIKSQWQERISKILNLIEINHDDKSLELFSKKYFPDMRSALNTIQRWQINGVSDLTESKINEITFDHEEIFSMVVSKPDPIGNYQYVVGQYSGRVDEVMASLSSDFIKWIEEKNPQKLNLIPSIVITVARYQSQRSQVIDPIVSLLALIFELQQMFNK
ncbi:MAG: AAA family ATPase [Spirochaetia bacterium]|nr:AAA family ATPase [Spirochaetia bacterium]